MMELGACVNDSKWLILLASWEPGIVQCELDKLGKLAGKKYGRVNRTRAKCDHQKPESKRGD